MTDKKKIVTITKVLEITEEEYKAHVDWAIEHAQRSYASEEDRNMDNLLSAVRLALTLIRFNYYTESGRGELEHATSVAVDKWDIEKEKYVEAIDQPTHEYVRNCMMKYLDI